MKKYAIIVLVLLGLGSCYYMSQNKDKGNQGTEMSAQKTSLEDAKAKIDSFKYLTEEEKIKFKADLDQFKDTNNFDTVFMDAEKLNSKHKIDTFEYLTKEEKTEFKNKLDEAKDLAGVLATDLDAEKMNAKNKIGTFEYLTNDETVEFKNKVNDVKSLDELYTTVIDAQRVDAKNKIDTLKYLTDEEKVEFKSQLDQGKNLDDFLAVLKVAQETNQTRSANVSQDNELNKFTVNFAFDSSVLTTDSKDKIKKFIEADKISKITIVGHTDLIGTEEYNQGLSVRRAKSVCDYLKNTLKVDVEIKYSGKGELNPISNINAKNRRAVIRIF